VHSSVISNPYVCAQVLTIKAFSAFVVLSISGLNQFTQPLPFAIIPAMAVSMALQVVAVSSWAARFQCTFDLAI
jgi:hypothetical protein